MKRFFKAFLPNLTIALAISLLVIVILDNRNPMMGFLMGRQFMILAISTCVCAMLSAIVLYASWRNEK